MPKIAIAITTINRRELNPEIEDAKNYLGKTLDSLFRPYVPDTDIIIFDDGSKDTMFIDRCVQKYPFLKMEKSPKRLGSLPNQNRALKYLLENYSLPWIFLIEDDVVFMSKVLEALPRIIEKIPKDAGMISLLTPYPIAECRSKRFVPYPAKQFYAFTFIGFKRELLHKWFKSETERKIRYYKKKKGLDITLSRWFGKFSKIYAYDPNLGQHIGKTSAEEHAGRFWTCGFLGENQNALDWI